jgi:hypothetical protein
MKVRAKAGAAGRVIVAEPDVAIHDHHIGGARSAGQDGQQAWKFAAEELARLIGRHIANCGHGFMLRARRGPAAKPDAGGDRVAVAVIDIEGSDQEIFVRGDTRSVWVCTNELTRRLAYSP